MSKNQKGNTLQYLSNNCLLVINQQGKIRQLFTPFLVTAINRVSTRKRTFIVEEVLSISKGELVYVINGSRYQYSQFQITINF
jgi:hypothetical protein